MNCLTKLFQQKRRRIGYIQAFSGPMISKRDSSAQKYKVTVENTIYDKAISMEDGVKVIPLATLKD